MSLIKLNKPIYGKNYGEGPLRYYNPDNDKYYHHRGYKKDKNPIFYKYPKEKSIKNPQWDCYDPNLFCSNCDNFPGRHTENNPIKNQTIFRYICKGHIRNNFTIPFIIN